MAYSPNPSSAQPPDPRRAFWLRQAAYVQHKVNVAWWLQSFLPVFCALSFVIACLVVVQRHTLDQNRYVWTAYGVTTVICALTCLLWVKKRFFTRAEVLVQLDTVMQLHNRLSSAFAGVGAWPPAAAVHDGLRWRWEPIICPVLLSAAVLAIAFWIPVRGTPTIIPRPTHKPLAWAEMTATLERLQQSDLIQEKTIERLRAQLLQLQNQAPQRWYMQSTLEATDALRQQMAHALDQLTQDLRQMAGVVSELVTRPPHAGTAALQDLREQFGRALDGLAFGQMPLHDQHLKPLRRIDPDSLKGLSRDQLAQLKAQLRNGLATLREIPRRGAPGDAVEARDGHFGAAVPPPSPGANGPGQGGINRGPGTAPLALSPRPGFGGLQRLEVLRGADTPDPDAPHHTTYHTKQPDVDRSQMHTITPGGTARVQGGGSAAVWKQTFTPTEREVLQRVFK